MEEVGIIRDFDEGPWTSEVGRCSADAGGQVQRTAGEPGTEPLQRDHCWVLAFLSWCDDTGPMCWQNSKLDAAAVTGANKTGMNRKPIGRGTSLYPPPPSQALSLAPPIGRA